MNIIPVFSSHYSLNAASLLTLEEAGKTKSGNAASIIDIALENKLSHITLCDDRMDGVLEAWKNTSKSGISLIFGLRLTVIPDMSQKDGASELQESKVIIFMRDCVQNPEIQSPSYVDLIRINNRAWREGFYDGRGRIDWKTLKELWTPNLVLALPYFSSFLARNLLTFSSIVPDLPCAPWVFREIDSELPFAHLIDEALDKYIAETGFKISNVKSIYYKNAADFENFALFRARNNHGTFSNPRSDNLASDRFSFESYKELVAL